MMKITVETISVWKESIEIKLEKNRWKTKWKLENLNWLK